MVPTVPGEMCEVSDERQNIRARSSDKISKKKTTDDKRNGFLTDIWNEEILTGFLDLLYTISDISVQNLICFKLTRILSVFRPCFELGNQMQVSLSQC